MPDDASMLTRRSQLNIDFRHRVAAGFEVFKVQSDRFLDVAKGLFLRGALTEAAGESGTIDAVHAVLIALNDDFEPRWFAPRRLLSDLATPQGDGVLLAER